MPYYISRAPDYSTQQHSPIWTRSDDAPIVNSVETGPWATVPPYRRSIVRAYINSEQESDKERALEFCEQYGLDYVYMRYVILKEMIEESRALGKA